MNLVSDGEQIDMERIKMQVSLKGCDDWTKFEIEVSESDAKMVEELARISEEVSTSGCQPTLEAERLS